MPEFELPQQLEAIRKGMFVDNPRPVFNFSAATLELAEAKRPCTCDGSASSCGMCWTSAKHDLLHCERCNGTGRIVLFPSLRTPCPPLKDGRCLHGLNFPCKGKRWVPVSDVRVACWEIRKRLEGQIVLGSVEGMTSEEYLLRVAMEWLKEQDDHTN